MSCYTHLQEHKMLTKLIKWLTSPQSDLERYILSKNPTNAAEVDYWTREFDKKKQEFVWARGL